MFGRPRPRAIAFVNPGAAAIDQPVIEQSRAAPGPPLPGEEEEAPPPPPPRIVPLPAEGIFQKEDGNFVFYRVDKRSPDKVREQGGFEGTFGWARTPTDPRELDLIARRVKDATGETFNKKGQPEQSIIKPLNNLTYNGNTVFAATDLQGALNFGVEEQMNEKLVDGKPVEPYFVYKISIPSEEIQRFKPLHVISTLENPDDSTAPLPIYGSAREYMDKHDFSDYNYNESAIAKKYRDAPGPKIQEMKYPRAGEENKEKKTPRRYWDAGFWDDFGDGAPSKDIKDLRLNIARRAAPFQNEVQLEGPIPLDYIEYSELDPIRFDTASAKADAIRRGIDIRQFHPGSSKEDKNKRESEMNALLRNPDGKPRVIAFNYMQQVKPVHRKILNLRTMEEAFPELKSQMDLHKNPDEQTFLRYPQIAIQQQSAGDYNEDIGERGEFPDWELDVDALSVSSSEPDF